MNISEYYVLFVPAMKSFKWNEILIERELNKEEFTIKRKKISLTCYQVWKALDHLAREKK